MRKENGNISRIRAVGTDIADQLALLYVEGKPVNCPYPFALSADQAFERAHGTGIAPRDEEILDKVIDMYHVEATLYRTPRNRQEASQEDTYDHDSDDPIRVDAGTCFR